MLARLTFYLSSYFGHVLISTPVFYSCTSTFDDQIINSESPSETTGTSTPKLLCTVQTGTPTVLRSAAPRPGALPGIYTVPYCILVTVSSQ